MNLLTRLSLDILNNVHDMLFPQKGQLEFPQTGLVFISLYIPMTKEIFSIFFQKFHFSYFLCIELPSYLSTYIRIVFPALYVRVVVPILHYLLVPFQKLLILKRDMFLKRDFFITWKLYVLGTGGVGKSINKYILIYQNIRHFDNLEKTI